jgi:YgiT-type zinc finger domain-containing protein
MTDPTPGGPVTYACPECQAGTLRLKRVVFARWFGDQFVTIPNFPGWVCDVCGEREYDDVALEQVRLILGPETEMPRELSRRRSAGLPDSQAEPHRSGRRPI